jgi:hypothetical protein
MNKDLSIFLLIVVIVLLLLREFIYNDKRVANASFDQDEKMSKATFDNIFVPQESQRNKSISSIIANIHKNSSLGIRTSEAPSQPPSQPPSTSPTLRPAYSLDKVENSAFMRSLTKDYPPSWKAPTLISAIADEKYLYSAQMFVESLLEIGFGRQDILLLCTNEICSHRLNELNINSYVVARKECENNLRCLISDGKTSLILQILNKGYAVFFFDLDVYIKAPILQGLTVQDNIDIYVQNNNDYKYPYDLLNYGMFLVRPSLSNIYFFNNISAMYRETKKWDQWIFNKVVEDLKHPYAFLPDQEYYLHTSNKPQNIKAVHLICVEGSQTKMFLGRELYGPFLTPSYYSKKKTLTAQYSASMAFEDLVGMINMLLRLAKLTGRWIRVVGFNHGNSISIFDADKLFNDDQISLVEQKYWDHVKHFNPTHNITSNSIAIPNIDSFMSLLTNRSFIESDYDDITLQIDQPLLRVLNDGKYNSYICKFWNKGRYQCLESCQGNHFRIRH